MGVTRSGSCVEVEYRGSRLILDIGRPLSAGRDEFIPLPGVPGLATGHPSIAAILLSHGHQDHWGLIDQVHHSIPVYIGKRAADVLRAADFWVPELTSASVVISMIVFRCRLGISRSRRTLLITAGSMRTHSCSKLVGNA